MSKADFDKYMSGKGTKAMLTVALSAHMAFMQAQKPVQDKKTDKTEQVAAQKAAFVVGEAVFDGTTYPTVNGNVVRGNTDATLKEELKEYRQEQKKAFKEAPDDFWNKVDFDGLDNLDNAAKYDACTKNIQFHQFDLGRREELDKKLAERFPTATEEARKLKAEQLWQFAETMNNPNSPEFLGLKAHEKQHENNDGDHIYAPGLNAAQYGMLNQGDEISGNVAHLLVLDNKYAELLKNGVSQEEALKIFDSKFNQRFQFYREALEQGLVPGSDKAKETAMLGTCKMWNATYKEKYHEQTGAAIDDALARHDAASLAMGNEDEFNKRVANLFDNLGNNEVMKELGINPGKLSQYLPSDAIGLTPEMQAYADKKTRIYTGLSLSEGKKLSDRLPGSPEKDARNWLKVLRGQKVSEKIKKVFHQETSSVNTSVMLKNRGRPGL